ncbi:CAP domain-containing protein [Mesorhizobium sp. ZMM04-5]|uniref:CAP domain-containing protein n=1 Tax=Mesorhizobium marinum TaxID=3228790 RepID=A0ABV3R623_9HYPH
MTDSAPYRRRTAGALALMCLLALAGCQSMGGGGAGPGVGASSSGATSLAAIRSEHGLGPLQPDARLERAAAQQAGYMASAASMTHRTGWGKDFRTRMRENGIEGAAAENVAFGRMSTEKLFSMWMNSAGHRRNMLDPRFSHYGLASAQDAQGRKYWALVLGR